MVERDEKTVLIVEDSDLSRKFIRLALSDRGDLRLLEAASVDRAWQLLQKTRVDLVLSDLHMPEKDGVDLVRMIRAADAPLSAIPVVIVTIEGDRDKVRRAMDAGASDYVTKPVEAADLRPVLARYLRGVEGVRHVLIVCDPDTWPGEVSQLLCRELGVMTHQAGDSVEAMHCLFSMSTDLLIVDLELPEGDGRTLVEQLKRNRGYNHIPVIAVGEGESAGAAIRFSNPLDGQELVSMARKLLRL